MKRLFKLAPLCVASIILASLLAAQAFAMQGRRGVRAASPSTNLERSELERDMIERELEEGPSTRPGANPSHPPGRTLFEQMSEDFTRIQVVNNELVRAAARPDALDSKFIARSAAEVRKLAQRLKANMILPEPEGDEERQKIEVGRDEEGLKATLHAMGKLIAGFAHNPVFREPSVVDAKLSAKARRDLEEIIDLSGRVTKAAEKLSKAAAKPQ